MKERPLLFSGPMVRAILSGHKTQTRRVVRPDWRFDTMTRSVWDYLDAASELDQNKALHYCPHGRRGGKIWVRETWCNATPPDPKIPVQYKADWPDHDYGPRWHSPIHMPRWASRLTLRVTTVYVQRLQTITGPDAFNEMGCDPKGTYVADFGWELRAFAAGWDELNAKRGYGWDVNPWVWAIHFRIEEERDG